MKWKGSLLSYLRSSAFICGSFLLLCGCNGADSPTSQVVLYTSVDQPVAAPVIKAFEQQAGIRVVLVTDAEATKSVGLAERLRAERDNPQADVFWGNEPFHTINLAKEGLLQPYASPAAKDIAAQFKDAQHRWAGNGLRARVIATHPKELKPGEQLSHNPFITRLEQLTGAELKDQIAMARPTAGTTGGHVAALYVLWGEEKADAYFTKLRDNGIKLLGGNSVVAQQVAAGNVLAGLTDNDDVFAARQSGGAISDPILPDQDSIGTLMVPTTVGLVAGARHAESAKKLIDHLLSAEVEQQLIDAKFAGWSLRGGAAEGVKWMDVDYAKVAGAMPRAVRRATAILEGRE